jgi:hypothetical protein
MRTVLGIDAAWTLTQPSGVALAEWPNGSISLASFKRIEGSTCLNFARSNFSDGTHGGLRSLHSTSSYIGPVLSWVMERKRTLDDGTKITEGEIRGEPVSDYATH